MRIINQSRGKVIAGNARLADSFFSRLRGLLGTKVLPSGHGLIIKPCNSVHTIGMAYPIDVVFLDHDGKVLKCVRSLAAWKCRACRGAGIVLELPAGTLALQRMEMGDHISFDS